MHETSKMWEIHAKNNFTLTLSTKKMLNFVLKNKNKSHDVWYYEKQIEKSHIYHFFNHKNK